MIKETEVCDVITSEIPGMAIDFSLMKNDHSISEAIACFADYTKDLIRERNESEILQCFHTANSLLKGGTFGVKNSIINVYVSSLSRIIDCKQSVEDNVRTQFLQTFGKEYYNMIYAGNP